MTKKDYVMIAEALRYAGVSAGARLTMAEALADSMKLQNANFNKKTFIESATRQTSNPDEMNETRNMLNSVIALTTYDNVSMRSVREGLYQIQDRIAHV